MEEKKSVNKLSSETFSDKKSIFISTFEETKKTIKSELEEKLKKAKDKQDKRQAYEKYEEKYRRAKNKYIITMNALEAQRLFRRGVLETKINELKRKYKLKKHNAKKFDVISEKKKLADKIKKLKITYSKPLARSYRKDRAKEVNAEKLDIGKVSLPYKSRRAKIIRTSLLIMGAAILTTIGLDFFLKSFGLYSAGLRGITQMFFYMILAFDKNAPQWYSYALFFAANIPLAIWGWFKLSKIFTIYTMLYLGTQLAFSSIMKVTGFEDAVEIFGFNSQTIYNSLQDGTATPLMKYAIIFISSIIGSILYGIGVGLIYRAGGSTGGSKFIVTYIGVVRNKSVGSIATIIGFFVISFGILINKILMTGDVTADKFLDGYTSTTLLASLVYVYISNMALDRTYNKNKKVQLDIITDQKSKIIYFLDIYMMYDKSYTVEEVKTGNRQTKKYKLEFIAHPLEVRKLKQVFASIDKQIIIIEKDINIITGKFYNSWFK